MTLPQPTGMRLLPRSPYRLRRRGREQAGGCQLLRFAVSFTRPDGTSARVLRGSGPVETTHPQATILAVERLFGKRLIATDARLRCAAAPARAARCAKCRHWRSYCVEWALLCASWCRR